MNTFVAHIELTHPCAFNGVSCVAWNSDGTRLVSTSFNNVCVWNLRAEAGGWRYTCTEILQTCSWVFSSNIWAAAWSSDGLLAMADRYAVRIWRETKGKMEVIRNVYLDTLITYALQWNGTQLAWGGADKCVHFMDVYSQQAPTKFYCEHKVHGLAWNTNGTWLSACTANGFVYVWDVATAQRVRRICVHGHAFAMAWHGNLLAVSVGREVRIIDLVQDACVRVLSLSLASAENIFSVSWKPDGRQLAVASTRGEIGIFGNNGKLLYRLCGHTSFVRSVMWSSRGTHLVSGCNDSTICIWDMQGIACQRRYSRAVRQWKRVDFNEFLRFLAFCARMEVHNTKKE